jgi:dTDP-4-amino-4,6-dideoxygalactose transaminase
MAANRNIPFLDLVTPHLELEDQLVDVFRSALRNAGFIGGPAVENFERDFAVYCEASHSVGVASGTDALRFALTAAGVRPGDTVVTVANTFIATTEAISQAGARPDFVDVDERTYNLDPEKLRVYLETKCTRDLKSGRLLDRRTGSPVTAVVPVHLYGQMADMDAILDLAAQYDLLVIEDACQAHGAEYFSKKEQRWRKAGSIGAAAAFSFYPGKNLGACGEAGAVTTNDERVARICRMLRDHGQSKKYYHDIEGYNGRLDAIQAGLLGVKLRHLPDWTGQRRACAAEYDDLFARADGLLVAPHVPEWSRPVYHLYVVRVADREGVQKELTAAGIGTGIHYPVPLHLSAPYASLGLRPGDLPVTERAAAEVLSLPMFPNLSVENQRRVAAELLGAMRRRLATTSEAASAQTVGVGAQPRV